MIRAILIDIEGTTTSIRFVTDVLFPYARENMTDYIVQHKDEANVRMLLNEVASIAGIENDDAKITRQLIQWIDEDQKITPLKTLQGMIWKDGYVKGSFKGHVYNDVEPALHKWHDLGISLYIYSSGSVSAQKLLFKHTEAGDLTPLFSGYFDTHIGNKRDMNSYEKIIDEIGVYAKEILFLSDVEEELDAAQQAGMKTLQLVREGTVVSGKHGHVKDFSEIELDKV